MDGHELSPGGTLHLFLLPIDNGIGRRIETLTLSTDHGGLFFFSKLSIEYPPEGTVGAVAFLHRRSRQFPKQGLGLQGRWGFTFRREVAAAKE